MDNEVFVIQARSGRHMRTYTGRFPTIEGIRDFARSFIHTNHIVCDVEQIVSRIENEGRVALSRGVLFYFQRIDQATQQ